MNRNDGRFPPGIAVRVRYPLGTGVTESRADWPWVVGHVVQQCGPDSWQVVVDGEPRLGVRTGNTVTYPTCFRASIEIWPLGGAR